jgi:tetratricopeptide (TPR) repeat protein
MRSPAHRRFAPLALAVAVHGAMLSAAMPSYAQRGRAPAAAAPQDLIARGRALFEDQQYEESIQSLSAALVRPNNSKAEKVEIYRLLALNYITLSRKEESESAVRGLLALQPDYALPASESPRFRDFFAAVKQKWIAEGRPGLATDVVAPPAPVTMTHNSPAQAERGKQLDLSATLTDPQHRVASVKLFYRHGSTGKFDEAEATLEGGDVHASVPPEAVVPTIVEYYLQGLDKGGLAVVSRGDSEAPLRVAVPDAARAWVLPVAISGGVLAAAGIIVGGVLLFGKGSSPSTKPGPPVPNSTTVTINIGSWR